MLSGTISTGMGQLGRVLLTPHGDSASGQQKPRVRAGAALVCQDTQHPPPPLIARSNRPPSTTSAPARSNSKSLPTSLHGPLTDPALLTWSESPFDVQVLPYVAANCVVAVVIRQGGATESIREGIGAVFPIRL